MLKAFLFDMDGVLYDSMKFHAEAWYQTMCQHYGFACDRKLFYLYEGSTGAQTIDTMLSNREVVMLQPRKLKKCMARNLAVSRSWA